ncbi:hypothetical protein SAV14893_022330 [Streptomyces avermitilis]|nr:hypothetical protein SAV14893_022330 [Streptomyces avermitilis]GDY77038.1 hypothetical protein SAV31267_065230 [Streptomyces avermitilis]GDY85951.1 hypothetical protein SAVCW2_51500 [Streptomyces avermitilis]
MQVSLGLFPGECSLSAIIGNHRMRADRRGAEARKFCQANQVLRHGIPRTGAHDLAIVTP